MIWDDIANPDGGEDVSAVSPDAQAVADWGRTERAHQSILDALWNLNNDVRIASGGVYARVPQNVRDAQRRATAAVAEAATKWSAYRDAVRANVRAAIAAGRISPGDESMLREGGLAGAVIVLGLAVIIAGAIAITGIGIYAVYRLTAPANANAQAVLSREAAIVAAWVRSVNANPPGAPLPSPPPFTPAPSPLPNVNLPDVNIDGGTVAAVAAVLVLGVVLFSRKG